MSILNLLNLTSYIVWVIGVVYFTNLKNKIINVRPHIRVREITSGKRCIKIKVIKRIW